jgi:phenylpropionate dioxygenase-like ring-hydroxylating dioxygenase large terminal subunit
MGSKKEINLSVRTPRSKPGDFYQHVLDTDTHPVPAVLRERRPLEGGPLEFSVDRYLTREFHDLEVKKIWKRVWQMACREEEIPEVGDTLVYKVASLNYIIVRSAANVIKAYPNACLHRGRRLVDQDERKQHLKCPYHGFTWSLDGTLEKVSAAWDFPQIKECDAFRRLPEAKVGTWGGFVFINPDPNAEPLEKFLGDLPRHFARAPLENRYISGQAVKVMPANWKIVQEAFMESFHVNTVHPQLAPQMAPTDAQYDIFGNFARAIHANMVPSADVTRQPTQQEMVNAALDVRADAIPSLVVPPGKSAREEMARVARESARNILGDEADKYCDAEMVDSFFFNVFPNLHPWASFSRICFRFRPNGDDPETSLMDVYMLSPFKGERPPASSVQYLGPDEDWTKAPAISGYLARILNQDLFNMRALQEGVKATHSKTVQMAYYQESKLRHLHILIEEWLERP